MGLKTTRKILSIVLAFIIAFSVACVTTLAVSKLTVGSESFFAKNIATSEIASQCEKQLDEKYEALSKKSNLPKEIFTSVTKQYNTVESLSQAVSYLFDDNDATLNNDSRVNYFYNLCIEYLDANNLDYNDDEIEEVCKEAGQIYSDTVGIHNMEYLSSDVSKTTLFDTKTASLFVILAVLSIVAIVIMYKKAADGLAYVTFGIMGGGVGETIFGLLKLLFKINQKINVKPEIFNEAFLSMIKTESLYLIIGGLMVFVIGVLLFLIVSKFIKREEFRKDTRFMKVIDKL